MNTEYFPEFLDTPDISFYSKEFDMQCTLSIDAFDVDEDRIVEFYVCISNTGDMVYRFTGLTSEIVILVYNELKPLIAAGDIMKRYSDVCYSYGLIDSSL